ncbi:LysM repeat protein [Anoxybacillus tepidamans]|uniref:LysM repeat protein n=1 Tax=Anoxybacteroides tepidamans TaxID=265948 RepID=A0A7W8IP51_9BACL|nr:LysM peptidoglycan-binding domain-containing protein [Anoxybacillus tepidamans]MBB5323446.1 LysM repeat protein [Anoxybacillus tepidamans]
MKRAHDRAEQLRKQIEDRKQKKETEIDVLSLPPRSEVHKEKQTKKKTKWKIKYPLIRLLALFFILLPISILGIYYANDTPSIVTVKKSASYEPIDIENETAPSSSLPSENELKKDPLSDAKATDNKKPPSDSSALAERASDQQVITHVVQENETLYSIAMHYYETKEGMDIIKKWNHLKTSQLHKGQVLQIPVVDLSK